MNTFERRCQFLLLLYPAAYRELRGEEIIGTLLEATAPGHSWPRPRDIRGLIFGGLRARAAFNRQFTTRANLRTALLVGVAAYLAYNAVVYVSVDVSAEVSAHGPIRHVPYGWPALLASALALVAVGLAFLANRRVVLAAALLAIAATCYAGPWRGGFGATVVHLMLLAALVALATLARGSKRPSRRWLVLIGLLAVLPVVPYIAPAFDFFPLATLLLAVAAVTVLWAVIDARPLIGVIVFFLGFYLPIAAEELSMGAIPVFVLPYVGILTAIGIPALWLLRRQSAHPVRPTQA